MSLLTVGSVAFDAIETPFGKTDKIIGGAATYIALASAFYHNDQKIVSVVGEDFPNEMLEKHCFWASQREVPWARQTPKSQNCPHPIKKQTSWLSYRFSRAKRGICF